MKTFIRFLTIFLAPTLALTITFSASAFFLIYGYYNPVLDRVNDAVEHHFIEHENIPISLFHDNIFIASKDINKGQKITTDSVERETYSGKDGDADKVKRYDKALLGATAKNIIQKGHLLFETELTSFVQSTEKPASVDAPIRDCQDGNLMSCLIMAISVICGVGAACTIFGGQIWVIVLAFRKSTLWGIGCLLLPLAAQIYEIKNWEQTKKAVKLQVVGFALLGLFAGARLGVAVKNLLLDDKLTKTVTVICADKDLPEGVVITKSDFKKTLLPERKVDQDALTDGALAIGHKVHFGIAQSMQICSHDLYENKTNPSPQTKSRD